MPCRDEYADRDTAANNAQKVHEVTELLCSFCKAYENPDDGTMPVEVKRWWKKHKEADKRMKEAQGRMAEVARLQNQRREIDDRIRKLREYE